MRINLIIAIVLLAIVIPLFATDTEKKIADSVNDAENDVHPDDKENKPLAIAEGGNVTNTNSPSSQRIKGVTSVDETATESKEDANVAQGSRNKTVDVRIGQDGKILAGQRLEVEELSSRKKSSDGIVDGGQVKEEGEHVLNASLEKKTHGTLQNETLKSENSTETGSTLNATVNSAKNKEGNILETNAKDGLGTANSTLDVRDIDAVGKEENDGEATVLDEDDFKLRGRVAVDYASKSAGALVIEKSGSFKGTSNLLNGDKDKYAIAPCEEKKFVVVSLSEDILVKEIKLANYERFSSTVKDFQVMGSQTMDTWVDLGTYHAEPGNGEQKFELIEPAWARYLKFKFLSHHGVEYYCTYSQIKVHGSTMVQGFHEQWEENEETPEKDTTSADEGLRQNETQANSNNDGSPANNESRDIQNRTNHEVTEVPSISELSIPVSLEYVLEGKLSSNASAFDGYKLSNDLLKLRSRASTAASAQRGPLQPLEVVGSFCRVSRPSHASSVTEASVQYSGSRMSTDLKQTLSILFGQTKMEVDKNFSYLLFRVPKSGRQDFRSDIEHQKIQPFNSSEEGRRVPDDKGIKKEGEKGTPGSDLIEDEENDLSVSIELNAAATSSSATQQSSSAPNQVVSSNKQAELDSLFAKILVGLPSADCLAKLDFADFKAKARKDNVGVPQNHIGSMEPIFKKLTDEIKSLQINLSTQEQFTKVSVACYQRVLLDLMSENEKTRRQHELRLSRLEDELYSSEAFAWRLLRSIASMTSALFSIVIGWGTTMVDCWLELWSWTFTAFFYSLVSGLKFSAQLWPPVKRFLLSFSPLYPEIIPPLVDHIDNLLQHIEQRWGLVYLPSLSGFTIEIIKITTLQFLSAALVYVILAHLRASLAEANAITSVTQNEEPKVRNNVPVVSPEKDAR